MPPAILFHTTPLADGIALRPEGDIDLARSPELRERLRGEIDKGTHRLVIDLSTVPYMDSSGVATLVEALQRSRSAGCRLILVGLTDKVRSIFAISRLDTVFQIVGTLDEAVQA